MRSLNLDFLDDTRLAKVNPVEMMVRGSLDLGVEAVISITFKNSSFLRGRRLMQLDYSQQQDIWRAQKRRLNDYVLFLVMFGVTSPNEYELASTLRGYENELEDIAKATLSSEEKYGSIGELGRETEPFVTQAGWVTFISKYTNGTYTDTSSIFYRPHVTKIIVKLFQSEAVGEHGLRYLVAWTIYRQLVEFTDAFLFLHGRHEDDACYEHVKKVMRLAIVSHYFQSALLDAAGGIG